MLPLEDRVAIVTGAAGNLGKATSKALREAGAHTVLVDREERRLAEAFPRLVAADNHLLIGGADLTEPASARRALEAAVRIFGRVDILVCTVGGFAGGKPVHEEDLAIWEQMSRANLRSTLVACRAVIPRMIAQGGGRIVTVGSRDASAGRANFAAYAASKTDVLRLTEALAQELRPHGVTANCVLPGIIDTPQNRAAMPDANHDDWVAPAAIADVILFLSSDASRAVSGAAIPVFGNS